MGIWITIGIIVVIIIMIVMFVISVYNSLVLAKNSVNQAFSGIDIELKKRYDLIPNLVETVKQYATHESSTLEKIVALRSTATSGKLSPDETVKVNNELTSAISNLMVSVEAYPELKANTNFLSLQQSLSEIETNIARARGTYNSAVLRYNNLCMMFPSNIIAGMMNFKTFEMFQAAEAERQNVSVKNLFNN